MSKDLSGKPDGTVVSSMISSATLELGLLPKNLVDLYASMEISVSWDHLGNGNAPFDVGMSFRDTNGEVIHRKSATKTRSQLVSWSIATIHGKKPGKEMSFVPYATNQNICSTWAVMDFDAHGGEVRRAYLFARDSYRYFQKRPLNGVVVFLEHTGAGGWHLWLVSLDLHPCAWWVALLKEAAAAIGAPIQSGVCELFPHESEHKLKGVRAYGTRHHGNGKNGTLWGGEALRPLIDELMAKTRAASASLPKKEKSFSFLTSPPSGEHAPSGAVPPPEERNSALVEGSAPLSSSKIRVHEPAPYKLWEERWSSGAVVNAPAIRHDRLAWLVGQMFYQVGRPMAERLALLQFDGRSVQTNADRTQHQKEFLELWRGLMEPWLATLSQAEQDQLQCLMTETERDIFRILHSFHRLAVVNACADFPVAQENLAARLGVSKQYAGEILLRFVALGILVRSAPAVPHKTAARYRWLLAAALSPATVSSLHPAPSTTSTPGLCVPTVNTATAVTATGSDGSPSSCSIDPHLSVAATVHDGQSLTTDLKSVSPPAINTNQLSDSSSTTEADTLALELLSPADMPTTDATPVARSSPTLSAEMWLLLRLDKDQELNLATLRADLLVRLHDAATAEAQVTRMAQVCERFVAAKLAFQVADGVFSRRGCVNMVAHTRLALAILCHAHWFGSFSINNIPMAERSVRGGTTGKEYDAMCQTLVAAGLLLPGYHFNPAIVGVLQSNRTIGYHPLTVLPLHPTRSPELELMFRLERWGSVNFSAIYQTELASACDPAELDVVLERYQRALDRLALCQLARRDSSATGGRCSGYSPDIAKQIISAALGMLKPSAVEQLNKFRLQSSLEEDGGPYKSIHDKLVETKILLPSGELNSDPEQSSNA